MVPSELPSSCFGKMSSLRDCSQLAVPNASAGHIKRMLSFSLLGGSHGEN